MLQLIDDQTASKYYNEIDTATGDDLQSKTVALEAWANNKKAERTRQEWDHVSKVFTDFDNYSAAEGLDDFDEESRYQYANRKFIANQTGDTPENQMFVYPSKRDEVTDKMFGKTGLSEKETFDLFKHSIESRNASEEALRELPGVLAQGVLKRAGEGKPFDEVDSWFAFSDWKDRHADKLASMPKGWETAMLDSAVKLHARTEQLMDDVAPESKRAMDTLMKFTRPEDAANLPDADRADVENLAKDFAKLTPEKREGIYATLSYAAEAGGAGMGKGFWEKVGEGMARGGGNIYDDAAITAQDRQARQNISFFQDLIDKPQAEPDRMQTADSIQMQRDMAQKGLEENKQRLGELRVMREIRDLAQGRIDPIKTEMDGVLGQVVQGAYDFSQSAAYTGMAMVPYVGLPAVMGALANSNYLRMLDQYPDMDADAAFDLSLAIAGPQAVIERFQGGLLLGKLPFLGKAMKKLTDVRVPLAARIGLGYGAVVGLETGTELIQEAMPVVADQLAAAVREDMPEFDAGKAWGEYREQAPKIFYSMLWGGLMGGGAVGIRELERSGIYMRNLQELEMHGITGEAAQDIAAERNPDAATALYREAWDKRSPEDIQAGIAKRAAMLDAAQATQANPDFPTRRIEENPDGTLTHIIEQNGQTIYSTNDPAAADIALIKLTRRVVSNDLLSDTSIISEVLDQWTSEDPTNVAIESDGITAQQKLEKLQAAGNVAQIEELHRRIATSQYRDTPYDQINILGEATVEDLGEMVFRGVVTLNQNSRPEDAREEIHHVAVRKALMKGSVTLDTLRGWLDATETALPDKFPSLIRENENDIVESLARVQRAYEDGTINAEEETSLPASFVNYIKRMLKAFKEVLQRAVALRSAFKDGILPSGYETFLADSVGLNQQARVDTASNRVSKDIITDGGQMLMDFSIGSRTSAVSTDTPSIRASNATITGPANYSIAAHHGTPHKVDKFSTEKIGTGEAAQAFGWGLYFAENITVAENYARGYRPDHLNTPERVAAEALRVWRGNVENAIDDIKANDISGITLTPEMQSSAVDLLKRGERPKSGNLYTVELDVEPEDLLDWDKPLSEQNEKVKGALISAIQQTTPKEIADSYIKDQRATGGTIYTLIAGQNIKQASELLNQLGIPGIRYLDGGSRSDGEGTYNYVAFDENLIKITEENGNRIPASQALAAPATGATNYSIGIAPNGNPSNLKPEEQALARSPEFKARLGDWEILSKQVQQKLLGENAVSTLLAQKSGEIVAMNRPGLGDITFLYGTPGKINKKGRLVGGGGLSHLIEQRNLEGNNGIAVAKMMPSVIAHGRVVERQSPETTGERVKIVYQNHTAILSRYQDGKPFSWLLTGWENEEGGAGVNPAAAYASAPSGISEQMGASIDIDPLNSQVVNPESVMVKTDENGEPLASEIARFRQETGTSNYSIGIARNAISQVSEKDDASRVGTAKLGTAKVPKNTPQDSNVSGDNVPDDLLSKQMEKMNYAHLPKNILSEKDPKKKRRKLINWFKKNLLALHDAFPEEFRARATHWYDGANRIAKEMGSQFQASVEQASGVIAVFSPQKDWFMNVAQAEQFMELWTNSQDVVLEESLVRAEIEGIIEAATVADKQKRKKVDGETKEQTAERREYNKALDKLEKEKRRKIVEQVIGKTIRQLDATPTLQGWGIRVLAQVTFGRNYRNLSPEGDRLGMATNDDGALSKNGWGSTNEIEKAVRIMKDGSLKNISDNLGNEHKVRNFYNNIAAPNTPYGDATIDTHAVAAAHLMPYGAKATEVGHNFGSGMNGSEVLGISGVYHLYLDAYREAAADRGILPRQMQSITWEAIRLVYPAATKNAATLAKSQKTWKDLTDDSARNTLVGGRIPSPVWAGANDNRESQALSSGLQEDGSGDVSGAGLLSGVRPTGAGRDGGVNYSIASQSEIDRVNRALGGMNRGPDERLKVYQRAKQKFSKLMAWNSDELAAMADTGSDDSQIRRTQILQGLGELDGIMSVLPPEVRGRVGGYTKLAGIAPMDVLKDGVKVSEVSGMNGAIISAWMREGQNIGQAGKQVSLPPGYEATENLSTKRADKAIADFFRDRIKKIDTELEKVLVREYTEAITKAVKQSRPKAGDNGVRKSTLGAETQKFADMVQRATLLDDEATPKRMAEIEAALTNPDATAEDISALSEEWSILNTFGDLDNRSSETLAQGLDWLKGQLQMGREAWRIKEQARIDEQRARAAATIEWLGKGTAKKRFADKGLMQRIAEVGNNYLLDHASFEQFVTAMLPPEIAANFSERLRKADMAAQSSEIRDGKGILDAVREGAKAANMSAGDAMLWLKGDQKNAVAYLEGRKVKDERIAIDLAQKIVTGEADRSKLTDADIETLRNELAALPADTQKEYVTIKRVIFRGEDVKLDMSRAKAIQLLLSWNQPDVQIKMRKEGWTDESATDLKALVNDPVSRSVVSYLQSLYGKGAGIVNPVYSRMFGMTMPQVKNYAPTRFLNAKDSKDIGLDGSPTATGTTPSFAKSRVTHSAKIAPEDALTVAQGHIAQQAHWVHFAELAREFRALLSSPDVRESLKQTHGDAVLKSAELWADQLEQRGGNKARESAWLNNVIGTAISGKAVASLGFNLKTLAMQLENTIRFGLSLDMKQIASALSQPGDIIEDIQTVWESDAIQNRLQGGATAEARFLFSRYAGKPNFAAKIAEASMTPINWLDSAGTSISSAIVYRANLNDALAAGMPENLAKQAALNAASEAIYRFAQPVSFGQKSIIENNGNVFAKTFFLFMSDPRLKTAILADAARGLATGRGNASEHIRRIVAVELMALVSHVISSAFKDAFSDDDDEEIWGIGGFAKAMLLAPFQGFFFAGSVAEVALSKLTGQGYFTSSQNPLLNTAESAIRAGSNLDDAFNFSDPEAMLKQWNNIFRSMAVTPTMAAPAVLLNMVKPVVGLYQNATTED